MANHSERRKFLTALVGASVTWPFATSAQMGSTYRLGFLLPLPRDAPVNAAFFEELRGRGLIEGRNLTVEYRAYGARPDLMSQCASELVGARVDAIVSGAGEAVRALQEATKTIPILGL